MVAIWKSIIGSVTSFSNLCLSLISSCSLSSSVLVSTGVLALPLPFFPGLTAAFFFIGFFSLSSSLSVAARIFFCKPKEKHACRC